MKGAARFQTSIASLRIELPAVSRISRKNIDLPSQKSLTSGLLSWNSSQATTKVLSLNFFWGAFGNNMRCIHSSCKTPKKIWCACRYFLKKYIPLKTNTLLFNFFEALPMISYRRKRPFVVTTRTLRKSRGLKGPQDDLVQTPQDKPTRTYES